MWRAMLRVAVTTELVRPQIVGHHDDEIRRPLFSGGGNRGTHKRQDTEHQNGCRTAKSSDADP
jgi:hypothetical protein